MSKKLYCGSLSYGVDSAQLEEIFSEFGAVTSAQVIMDRDTGRSKGFGFVEFSNAQDADTAIEQMDGASVDGRRLQVNEAKPREERSRGYGGGGGGRKW